MMRKAHLLNPLQWNFAPRTVATLLAWALLPVLLAGLAVARSFRSAAAEAGIDAALAAAVEQQMLTAALWVTIPLLIGAGIAAFVFANLVVKPLLRLREAMNRIAEGDLSQPALPVVSRDEVGQSTQSFNIMSERLAEMVRTIAKTASELDQAAGSLEQSAREASQAIDESARETESVRSAADSQAQQAQEGARAIREVEDAAAQVAAAAQSQAEEVERAAETVRQMASAIEQVAESAEVVAEAASRTRRAAEDGSKAVLLSAEGMDQVRTRVLDASAQVQELSQSLHQVDEILDLIAEIAGQTNLLALNAAIEAARVGEHGKGFAVVAGEVRRLAERVRSAAEEIGGRVQGLRESAAVVVATMETGTGEVERGVTLSREAGAALDRILAAVAETEAEAQSISAAAEQISAASQDVVNVTVQLSAIAEENAATSEQMSTGARSVSQIVSGVEEHAQTSRTATATMASSAVQVRASVEQMVQLADRAAQMASNLHQKAAQFRF